MGYNSQTLVSCTNPEILASGSTFNQEWVDFLLGIHDGEAHYFCRKEYVKDAIVELSKKHPDETFTGVTWNDSDYYDSIKYTLIIKNGEYDVVKVVPAYQIFFPVIKDDEYNRLAEKFRNHIELYLNRLDIIKVDPAKDQLFDMLNDKEDEEGFISYWTITWENNKHRFTATKRYTSHVMVGYEKK